MSLAKSNLNTEFAGFTTGDHKLLAASLEEAMNGFRPVLVANLSGKALARQCDVDNPDGMSLATAARAVGELLEILDYSEGQPIKAIILTDVMNKRDLQLCEDKFKSLPFELHVGDFCPCEGVVWAWLRGDISWPKGSSQPKCDGMPRISPPRNYKWKIEAEGVIQKPWSKLCPRANFMELDVKDFEVFAAPSSGLDSAMDEVLLKRQRTDYSSQNIDFYADKTMVSASKSGARRLWAAVEERLMGLPDGASNKIEKIPNEPRERRQVRRHALIAAPIPVRVLASLLETVSINAAVIQQVAGLPYGIDSVIDPQVWGACPFFSEGHAANVDTRKYVGPDECEMDAQFYGLLAEGLQARNMVSTSTPLMAVPSGLAPAEHFQAGIEATSPLEQDRPNRFESLN